MSFIDNLRNKPDGVKKQIAFWTATFVVVFMGLVCTTTLPARFSEAQPIVAEVQKSEEGTLKKSVSGVWSSIKSQAAALIETMQSAPKDEQESGGNQSVAGSPEAEMTVMKEEPQSEQEQHTTIATSTDGPKDTEQKVILIGTTTNKTGEQNSE